MAKKQTKSTTEQKVPELRSRIQKEQEELGALLLDKSQFKLKNTSVIRIKKDQIARLLTALRQVEMEAES